MDMMNMTQPQSERAKRLRDIQNYNFTAYAPCPVSEYASHRQKALEMHSEIVKKLDQATKEFEKTLDRSPTRRMPPRTRGIGWKTRGRGKHSNGGGIDTCGNIKNFLNFQST